MTTKTTTKTQQRAVCAACFAQQAVTKSGALVAHGYTRPQHWHSNVNTCVGAGHLHFGTPAGRDFTTTIVESLRALAQARDEQAASVLRGSEAVMTQKRVRSGYTSYVTLVAVESPTQEQRARYAASLNQQAQMMREQAAQMAQLVDDWKAEAPISVAVEAKQTLLHWRGGYWNGKACASSAMGAQKGWTSSDITKVTCEKCKAEHARLQQKKAAR